MLSDFIRVFSCEGAQPFLMAGLVIFAVVGGALSYLRPLDTARDRFRFLVCMTLGVFTGALIFILLHDGCVPRW